MYRPLSLLILLSLAASAQDAPDLPALGSGRVVRVRQDGEGDFRGSDQRVLDEAMKSLDPGDILEIGPGDWPIRKAVGVPVGVTVRGSEGTLLRLPKPVLVTEAAAAGTKVLKLSSTTDFVRETLVQIVPPVGQDLFANGEKDVRWAPIDGVGDDHIVLYLPLEWDLPAGSRLGYSNKMLNVNPRGHVVLENLRFDGGYVEEIPLEGHYLRTAIWASAPFGYGEERKGPPAENVTVRHCTFRDFYGRGVAMYHVVDSLVEGCTFENIRDEAIDFDHFCYRNRAVGNEIKNAIWGIVLNDTADCVVEYNHVEGCMIGIHMWWWHEAPQDLNVRNVIRHNFLRGSSGSSIELDLTCTDNLVEHNWFETRIVVKDPRNLVRDNWRR